LRISTDRLAPGSRQKVYLILVFVSLIFLVYSIGQVYPVVVKPEAPLGLVSYLTPAYWIGLALIVAVSILAFLDRELKKDAIFVLILLALGLFLFGIRALLYECAQDTDSYYPVSVVYKLLAEHHLDIAGSTNLGTYYSWPAIHFVSASLLEITEADLLDIMKYTPVFWILCFVLTTYGIGKRLKLTPDRCFLLSLLALSSWWISFSAFYYPRFIAVMFFLLILMLSLRPKRTVPETIVLIVMYVALVISHGEIAISASLGLILVSIYRRDYRLLVLFTVTISAWYVYQVSASLPYGMHYVTAFFRDIFSMGQMERYDAPYAATGRLVARYSQLSSVALFGILMIWSLVLLMRRKITGHMRDQVVTLFALATGVALFSLSGMSQAVMRAFILCIVPAAGIIAVSFYSRKLLVPLILIFISLSLLINYASLAGFGQATASSLAGSKYLALDVKPDSYFSLSYRALALYYDPNSLVIRVSTPAGSGAISPNTADISLLDEYHYVVDSRYYRNSFVFSWGWDPYAAWPQTEAGLRADLIYDNGYFQIYENDLVT
jgi:hypothetical protein